MNKPMKSGASNVWVAVIAVGILACLAGVLYTFYQLQAEAGDEGTYQQLASDLRLVSQELVVGAGETERGAQETFDALQGKLGQFDQLVGQLQPLGIDSELAQVRARWQPIEMATGTLLATGPRIVFIHDISKQLAENIRPVQSELTAVVDILRDEQVSSDTIAAAQKTLWLTERIARNIDKILAGGADSQAAADEFRTDAASFSRIADALKQGNTVMGIQRLRDRDAIASLDRAEELFQVVSTSIDQIADASAELREAALARQTIDQANPALLASIADLVPAIDWVMNARVYNRGTLLVAFGAPALLAVALLVFMYRSQRQRVVYTERGVDEINSALERVAEGDLTIVVPEDNAVTRDIARQINASIGRQRELIMNIRTPFEVSIEEINKIGRSARQQVEKGKELTQSVAESTAAANEMVHTSEKIKAATAEAATTSKRNSEQVAVGYELTKDMSKASADVREAVQETSKSAKRQGELIQSVTTAAEYIQALNTKISVVAINTRIEAEKAGEHGRPFLGIAEAIGDLLREAEEEGRKIISEVRMLQNMSADNLASMENTVGNIVTILEYIERLDKSLEDINAGSNAISSIVTSVDDGAGHSAERAQYMNQSMSRISERNLDISEYSGYTQLGVGNLQKSMRDVAQNLSQFKVSGATVSVDSTLSGIEELEPVQGAPRIYREEEMRSLENEAVEEQASV